MEQKAAHRLGRDQAAPLYPEGIEVTSKFGTHSSGVNADPFMQAAIDAAIKSRNEDGIPIGSALVRAGELIAVGHNKRVQDNDPVTHAEIDCLRNAGRIGSFLRSLALLNFDALLLCAGAVGPVRDQESNRRREPNFRGRGRIHATTWHQSGRSRSTRMRRNNGRIHREKSGTLERRHRKVILIGGTSSVSSH